MTPSRGIIPTNRNSSPSSGQSQSNSMNTCHLMGKNRNEFVVRTDNNPLTYIFSSTNLDAAGQRWVAQLASYNFSLEYQKGKDNTVADFLSRLDETLPKEEVQDYLDKIPIRESKLYWTMPSPLWRSGLN